MKWQFMNQYTNTSSAEMKPLPLHSLQHYLPLVCLFTLTVYPKYPQEVHQLNQSVLRLGAVLLNLVEVLHMLFKCQYIDPADRW